MNTVTADRTHKHQRLAAILDVQDATSILLTRPETLAWYFDGARTSVPLGGAAVFAAQIHRDGTTLVTALENEADRLADEEIAGAEIRRIPWHADLTDAAPGALRDTSVVDELRAARASLLPVERERYTALGRDAAQAMTRVLSGARPDMSEHQLAANLSRAVFTLGAEPAVVLVSGAARAGIQHPLPTHAPLGDHAMAVITAKRFGLHLSLTRWVRFTAAKRPFEGLIREVEADAFAATRPGRELRDVLADIASSYHRHGFGTAAHPAWLAHHQGGPTGYLGRDPKASPASSIRVASGGAFAWNPWVPHAKVEDTVIVDEGGIDVLSVDPIWPTVNVRGFARPLTLDLS